MVYSSDKLLVQVLLLSVVSFILSISILRFLQPQLQLNSIIILLITSFSLYISYYQLIYQYWNRRNLPFLKNQKFFPNFISGKHSSIELAEIYKQMKQNGWKHGGMFTFLLPMYTILDLEYVKNIFTKDFEYFSDRGIFYDETNDPMSAHLINLNGHKWKTLRKKITPLFTSSKIKQTFQTLLNCEIQLRKQIELNCEQNNIIEIKQIASCYGINAIGSCAFGLELDSFNVEKSAFFIYGKKLMDRSLSRKLKRLIANTFPKIGSFFHIKEFDGEITDFYRKLIQDIVKYREENNVKRQDFMQLLIDLKNTNDEDALTLNEIIAQSLGFFIAGYETSASTIAFGIYELAKHQDIQEKVRNEIWEVLEKYNNQLTYEAIKDMKYLEQIVNETSRKYPVGSFLTRKCVKDYNVPDSDVVIEKGTGVVIPILAIHYDEDYYPNPKNFDPERFNSENNQTRHPYAFLPFGEGPRICIGKRFGDVLVKVAFISLIQNFRFTVNPKTQEPLKMNRNSLVLAAETGIWLNIHKL